MSVTHWLLTDIFFGFRPKWSIGGVTHTNIDGTDCARPAMYQSAISEQL